jgi:hydrogenase maturation protease
VGVEPQDIETVSIELTPLIQERLVDLVQMVLEELDRLGINYHVKENQIPCA